jgi:hypothetical protein
MVLAGLLAAGLAVAAASGGRVTPAPQVRIVGQPAPGPFSDARYALPAAAARAARTFLEGYLAYMYGHGSTAQIKDASPQLIAKLPLGAPNMTPAGRRLEPRIVRLGAREAGGTVQHVTALIADGIARYPIRTVMVLEPQGWETTQFVSAE